MKRAVLVLLVLGPALVASAASAEDKRVITLKTTDVHGTVRRPTVVIEVTKERMQLPATTPTLAGAGRPRPIAPAPRID